MDDHKQFETMAAIRAYARELIDLPPTDIRPSTARTIYAKHIDRMAELVKQLERNS